MKATRSSRTALLVSVALAGAAPNAWAGTRSIQWLDMSKTSAGPPLSIPVGSAVPSGSIFNLPGYGNVELDYTGSLGRTRGQFACEQNVTLAATHDWTTCDLLSQVNFGAAGTFVSYQVKYTFLSGPIPKDQLVLGANGLGRLDLIFPGNVTDITYNASPNGTFLGDLAAGCPPAALGPTCFSAAAFPPPGSFSIKNCLPGNGSAGDPSFNTDLGVVQFNDSLSGGGSITLDVHHIGQDGMSFSLGIIGPGTVGCCGDTGCPCSNNGVACNGCANSANPAGANLSASVDAYSEFPVTGSNLDTVKFTASGMPTTATAIVFKGTAVIAPVVFGDGKRCCGGPLRRLTVQAAVD